MKECSFKPELKTKSFNKKLKLHLRNFNGETIGDRAKNQQN